MILYIVSQSVFLNYKIYLLKIFSIYSSIFLVMSFFSFILSISTIQFIVIYQINYFKNIKLQAQ